MADALPDWANMQAVPSQVLQDFCASLATGREEVGGAFEVASRLAIFGAAGPSVLAFVDDGRLELIATASDRLTSMSLVHTVMLKKIARRAVQEEELNEQIATAERRAKAGQALLGNTAGAGQQDGPHGGTPSTACHSQSDVPIPRVTVG